jgi:hypothetical protein
MAGLFRLREIILNVAYKACEGKNNLLDSSNFTYTRATGLIFTLLALHLGQLSFIIFHNWIFPIKTLNVFSLFVLLAALAILAFWVHVVFPKRILNMNNQSSVDSVVWYPKFLAFSYLIVNLILFVFLLSHFQKLGKLRVGI